MATSLPFGGKVVELVRRFPEREGVIAVVRHSERPDFANVPVKDWNEVSLTDNGYDAAREFGRTLVQVTGISSQLSSYGWGLKRCQETSSAIVAGANAAGCRARYLGAIHMKSPIADRGTYDRQLGSKRLEETILDWLNMRDQEVFVPVRDYVKAIVGQVLAIQTSKNRAITVIATHDLHILPLLSGIFGRPIRYIDYLDGLVVQKEGEAVQVGFGDMVESYKSHEKLQ